jgi:hypothetical protein
MVQDIDFPLPNKLYPLTAELERTCFFKML